MFEVIQFGCLFVQVLKRGHLFEWTSDLSGRTPEVLKQQTAEDSLHPVSGRDGSDLFDGGDALNTVPNRSTQWLQANGCISEAKCVPWGKSCG